MLNIPVEIKTLLQSDSVKKNFRVHFPNGEFVDLTNADIVSESVSFTESICSQSELKFGLCESPYIEFECVNIGNIKGATIECSIEIVCPSSVSGAVYRADIDEYVYPIPYGRFVVDECKKQADMSHRKIVAYSNIAIDETSNLSEQLARVDYLESQSTFQYDVLKRAWTFYNSPITTNYTETTDGIQTRRTIGTHHPDIFELGDNIKIAIEGIGFGGGGYPNKLYKLTSIETTKTYQDFEDEVFEKDARLSSDASVVAFVKGCLKKYYNSQNIIGNSTDSIGKSVPIRYVYGEESTSYNNFLLGNINRVKITISPIILPSPITPVEYEVSFAQDEVECVTQIVCPYFGLMTKTDNRSKRTIEIEGSLETVYMAIPESYFTTDNALEIGSSCMELECGIGRINRDSTMSILNLAEQTLADTFDNFVDVWYEDDLTKPYGAVCCTWKDSSDEENYSIVYLTGYDEDTDTTTYQTYDLSDNYLIRESTWTEETIDAVLQRASEGLEGLQYMPMDMTIQGRPDIQSGDLLEVETDDTSFNTIVMQRTLKGVQSLLDDITSD